MANPIQFEVKTDPRKELLRQLDAAPADHAEAILVAFDVLESAHRKGLLDLAHGVIGSKDAVFAKIAEYAVQKESTNALRNLLSLGKILGGVNPELLSCVGQANEYGAHKEPPSLWRLLRRAGSVEGRRGLAKIVDIVVALGSSK